jgi:hypothetical protein
VKTILFFLFLTICLNAQELKITDYDNTADYYNKLYKLQMEEKTEAYFKKDFRLRKTILIYFKVRNEKYFNLMRIHEVDFIDYDKVQYRGIVIYGMYYMFEILNYYMLKYDWEPETFLCDAYHIDGETNRDKKILSLSRIGHQLTCKKRITLVNGKIAKIIDFYEPYGAYGHYERYIFSIILKGE